MADIDRIIEIEIPELGGASEDGARTKTRVAFTLTDSLTDAPTDKIAVVLGGISANRYVSQKPDGSSGWWPWLIGPGKCIDPKDYRVLSFDFLGGNGDTSGPQNDDPHTRREDGTFDQAVVLSALLAELGLRGVDLFVGASYGGMVGLAFAERYPSLVKELIVLCAAHKSSPYSVALRTLQRKIMQSLSSTDPDEGVALARALAMISYRSETEFNQRFTNERTDAADPDSFPVWSYLRHHGDRYAQAVHPKAYEQLSRSIDLHNMNPEKLTTPLHVIAARSDQLVPLAYCEELVAKARGPKQLHLIESIFGHDAFLKEEIQIQHIFETRRKVL